MITVTRRRALGALIGGPAALSFAVLSADAATLPLTGQPLAVRTPDGLTVSARVHGDSSLPGLVFVHGLGQSRLCWDAQIVPALTCQFRVVTYDLRGRGDSDKPQTMQPMRTEGYGATTWLPLSSKPD